jgi:hypothetical protein
MLTRRPNAFVSLLLACSIPGCAVAPRSAKAPAASAQQSVTFSEPIVERAADTSVVRPSLQKAYFLGRIVDPKYPELMHGEGIVFRRERAEAWNTASNSMASTGYKTGPIRSMTNGAEVPGMTEADAEIHEARSSAIVDALLEQNADLVQKLAEASKTAKPPQQDAAPSAPFPADRPATAAGAAKSEHFSPAPAGPDPLVTIAPSADNVIELSPALLEPPIPGLTNPFRQRYQFETQLRETKVIVSGIALGPQPSCVLGERIYNVGDAFESFTIASIDAEGIFLRKESFLLRIPMQDAAITLRYP